MQSQDQEIVDKIFEEQTKIITEYLRYIHKEDEDNNCNIHHDLSESLTLNQIQGIKEVYLSWLQKLKINNDINIIFPQILSLSKLEYFLPCDTNSNLTSFRPSTRKSAITFNHKGSLKRIYIKNNKFTYITPQKIVISDTNFENIVDKIWKYYLKNNDQMNILTKNRDVILKTDDFFRYYNMRDKYQ